MCCNFFVFVEFLVVSKLQPKLNEAFEKIKLWLIPLERKKT